MRALAFLQSLDAASVIQIFWFAVVFEIPRYAIATVALLATGVWRERKEPMTADVTLSVILAGHNEEMALRSCIESLAEQTILAEGGEVQVIVIDDGSTDRTFEVAEMLRKEGKIDQVLRMGYRGGKSAAINLGLSVCVGELIIMADIDTTFDRNAIAELLACFDDPRVGAVSGDLGVRNAAASLMTRHQAIEYAISISLGRRIQDWLGILSVVSGAFGAFRRAALEEVGGQDVEVGEDADLTMKLRRAGWIIRFAAGAHALTDVPETVSAFAAQRMRWDRGLVTIFMRKFRNVANPRMALFRPVDVMAFLDILLFQVVLTVAFPVYLVWLFHRLGDLAIVVIVATLIGYLIASCLLFAATIAVGIQLRPSLLLYLPFYTVVQISLARLVRFAAIAQEFIFRASYRDPYVPARVMSQVDVL